MKIRLFTTYILLIYSTCFNAQNHEFLKTPLFNESDLSKQKSSIDSDAPAEFLYRSVYIGNNTQKLIKKYDYRIKIYDKEKAEQWLNLEIPLIGDEKLDKINASTHNLENGKHVTDKVEKSAQLKNNVTKNVNTIKIAFPNVKNGSIIEYSYTVESPYHLAIPEVYIENELPSLYTEYVLEHPANVTFNMIYTGEVVPKYRENRNITLYNVPFKTFRLGFENIKGFKSEKFVKNLSNYTTKIGVGINEIGGRVLFSSWDNLRKDLKNVSNFGEELSKTDIVKKQIPANLITIANKQIKADSIFRYVQKNYTWDKNSGFMTDKGIRNLLSSKTGNAAEMNFLLIMMLKEAGLEAYPLLISTVRNGFLDPSGPTKGTTPNFVIAAVKSGKDFWMYDATSKQSSRNNLPPRDWNNTAVLFEDDKASILEIENTVPSSNILTINAKINQDGSIIGKYTDTDTSSFAITSQEKYDDDKEKYKKIYKENFDQDFTNIKSETLTNGDFQSTMDFSANNLADIVGKKIFINPLLFLTRNSNQFDQKEQRKYPIDFQSPTTKVKKVILEIPEGYEIETMPKPKKIKTDDNEIEYSYTIEKKGNLIEVISTSKIASSNYPKEYYPIFKQVWSTIQASENQVINLIKK